MQKKGSGEDNESRRDGNGDETTWMKGSGGGKNVWKIKMSSSCDIEREEERGKDRGIRPGS